MKLKTRKATNSYETDEELAAAVMNRMGKQVRETLNANAKKGINYGMADTKERLADMIRSRRNQLESRGYNASNRAVLDSLGKDERFRSKTERSEENALKGLIRSAIGETIEQSVDESGRVHYKGIVELPNGRYQDLATGKLVSKKSLAERIDVFKESGFVPGETKLTFNPISGGYEFRGTDGYDYEVLFGKEYTKTGGFIIKKVGNK